MKKFFAFACAIFATLSINAQQVYGLTSVVKNGKTFVAYADQQSLEVNPYLYKRIKKSPTDYVLVVYNGERGTVKTIAHRANVSYAVLSVDSIGYDEDKDMAEVYLSDKSIYKSANDEWLQVLKGQHVERWLIDGETKTLQHFRTVPRDVELTTAIPYETVPGVRQADTAMVSNPAAPAAKVDNEVTTRALTQVTPPTRPTPPAAPTGTASVNVNRTQAHPALVRK